MDASCMSAKNICQENVVVSWQDWAISLRQIGSAFVVYGIHGST